MISPASNQTIFDFITDDVPHVDGVICSCSNCEVDRFISAILFYDDLSPGPEACGDCPFPEYYPSLDQLLPDYEPPITSPSNLDMHIYNGNLAMVAPEIIAEMEAYNAALDADTAQSGYGAYFRQALRGLQPGATRNERFAAGTLGQILGITVPVGLWGSGVFETTEDGVKPKLSDFSQLEKDIDRFEKHPDTPHLDKIPHKVPNVSIPKPSEISNKDSHIENGNILSGSSVPKRVRKFEKRLKRKVVKKELKKEIKQEIKSHRTKPLRKKAKLPSGIRDAGTIDNHERRIAGAYSRFLKNPVYPPPKLGSTGNMPTKIVHGYYTATINMANYQSVANQTSLLAFISPCMFRGTTSSTFFSAPLTICTASNDDTAFSAGTTTVTDPIQFANDTALKYEVNGSATSAANYPPARYLGGSVSFQCRCPLTTNPPFLYAGLLDTTPLFGGNAPGLNYADPSAQLNRLKGKEVLALSSTFPLTGMVASSVYQPLSSSNLQFNQGVAQYSSGGLQFPPAPIAYVGMNGCPTSATVQITCSMWFEIQQTKDNYQYSGWSLGPKVSTEDVFDHLNRFSSASNRSIGTGAKGNFSAGSEFSLMLSQHNARDNPPVDRIQLLEDKINRLSLLIEEDEDEKYFENSATPNLDKETSLSKSTIDLALSLRKALTPGTVTGKTVLSSLP